MRFPASGQTEIQLTLSGMNDRRGTTVLSKMSAAERRKASVKLRATEVWVHFRLV